MSDLLDLEKCRADPKYFIERFFWVIDKERKKIPFIFNYPQKKYYANRSNKDLILKARKEGLSTLIEALFLHACLFGKNVNAVTMSHTMDDTTIHLERVRHFLSTMGTSSDTMRVELDKENQREISFPKTNSKYWIGTAGSRAFGRGRDVTHLHLSEAAWYESQTVLTGVMEACVPGSTIVMETTANGIGEMFSRLWADSKDPAMNSPWKRHFFSWFDDPTNILSIPEGVTPSFTPNEVQLKKTFNLSPNQIYWYHQKRSSMSDQSLMVQEYPSNDDEAFLSSGGNIFDVKALSKSKLLTTPPIRRGEISDDGHSVSWKDQEDGKLSVWKFPRQTKNYLVSADIAEGVSGGDYSVAQVFDRSSWEQVAVWRGHVDPGTFGKILCDIGYYWNNAVLVPENNNHGWASIERIKTEGYPHLVKCGEIGWDRVNGRGDRFGFPTDIRSKPLAITAMRNAVDDQTVFFNDATTLEEMMGYVRYQNGDFGPSDKVKGHDDCVMSAAIGVYALKFLSLDDSYSAHARQDHDAPMIVSSAVPTRAPSRARRKQ